MKYSIHAVEQYIERWRPTASYAQALAELRIEEATARPQRERSLHGDRILQSAHGVRFVVKDEPRGRLCVTILPKTGQETEPIPEAPPQDPLANALERIQSYLAKQGRKGDRTAQELLAQLRTGIEESRMFKS